MNELTKKLLQTDLEIVLERYGFQGGVFFLVAPSGVTQFSIARDNREFITGMHHHLNHELVKAMSQSKKGIVITDGGNA